MSLEYLAVLSSLRRVGVVHRHRHRVFTVHKSAEEGDVVDLNLA
jgi:hypothetical protein